MRMSRGMMFGAALAGVCTAATGAPWSGTHTVQVFDSQLNMQAFTMSVPNGWRFAGVVVRDPSCRGNGPGLKTVELAPDGITEIRYVPGFRWMWTDNATQRESMQTTGCPAIDIGTAASFLVNIAVPNLHKQATILAITKMDPAVQSSLASQLAQMQQGADQAAARYGTKAPKWSLDGARVRIRYQLNGKPVDEQVQAIVQCSTGQLPPVYMQPSYMNRDCTARSVFIVRAPQGQLDALAGSSDLTQLNKGTVPQQQWVQKEVQDQQDAFNAAMAKSRALFQQMLAKGRADHAALTRRGEAFQASERQSFEQAQAQDRATQAAIDKAAHGQVLDSLNRRDYTNPNTGETIEASSYYDHQWLSSDGKTLISTDDHTFDPNGVVDPIRTSWTELVPK